MPDPTPVLRSLREAEAAMTRGTWVREGNGWIWGGERHVDEVLIPAPVECGRYCYGGSSRVELTQDDGDGIVTMRNAFAALIDVAEAAARTWTEMDSMEHGEDHARNLAAALDRLAALAAHVEDTED